MNWKILLHIISLYVTRFYVNPMMRKPTTALKLGNFFTNEIKYLNQITKNANQSEHCNLGIFSEFLKIGRF